MTIWIQAHGTVQHLLRSALRAMPIIMAVMLSPAQSMAERILDQMWIVDKRSYNVGNGNHSGGLLVFGKNYSLQLSEDFYTTSTGYVITEVEIGNLTFGIQQPASAWVSVYEVARGGGSTAVPKEKPLYEARHEVVTNTPFDDPVFGLAGLKTAISGLNVSLAPNTQYFISIQTEGGDWAYTAGASVMHGAHTFVRDNARNGYQGGYGWTTWRANTGGAFESPAAAYRIDAVPEPGAAPLLVMLVSAAGSLRKRPVGLRPNDAFEK